MQRRIISLHGHSGRRKLRKRKSRKRLAYGIIAVAFVLAFFLIYFSLYQSNQTSQPKAAIVDHLSRREPNQTFVQTPRTILEEAGFDVDYYGWQKLTDVNYYKSLFKQGYDLFVLRVHSATLIGEEEFVALFTWEEYSDYTAGTKYRDDVLNDRLVKAFFQDEPDVFYFGITHKFIENYGNFEDAVIIMMGCNGSTYNSMADAFVKKGAKAYIGWDGPVGVNHTDQATLNLLQSLILEKRTIREAVEGVEADPDYESELKFYPDGAGDYTIPNLKSSLTMDVTYSPPKLKTPTRSKYRIMSSARIL